MKTIVLFGLMLLLLFSCTKECREVAGEDITEQRTVESFQKIEILDQFIIYLIQDSLSFVELEGKENLIKQIGTDVENGVLTLDNNTKCKLFKGYHKSTLYIHFKTLEYIGLQGNSELYSSDSLCLDYLFINSRADITKWNLKLKTKKFEMQLHAVVGELEVLGVSENVLLYSSGSNRCNFKNLVSQTANINQSSMGQFDLMVQKSIDISVNRQGDFYCYGNPPIRRVKIDENVKGTIHFLD